MILRPFALVGFSFALSLLALALFDGALYVLPMSAVCILLLCIGVRRLEKRGVYAVAMLAVLLACFCFNVRETYTYRPAVGLAGENVAVRAELVSNPVYSDMRWSATLRVISVDGKAADCKLAVRSEELIDAQPCDVLEFTAPRLFSTEEIDPEIKNYYKSKNIFLVCYNMEEFNVIPTQSRTAEYFLLKINSFLTQRLDLLLNGDEGALAVGILTGNKADLPHNIKADFSKSGLSHVLAVSGLHMSILIMSLYKLLCSLFGRYRKLAAAVCIAAAVLYAGVTGFSPSATRACIMLSIMMLGKLISRRADTLNSIGLAALAILLANPYSVADWSFMLSFSATLGIVLLNRPISSFSKTVGAKIKQPYFSRAVCTLLDAAGISLAATLFCLPVMVFFVGRISLVFIPANLLTLYAVPTVLLTALTSATSPGVVSKASAFLCEAFSAFILRVADFLAGLEYSSISADNALIKASLAAAMLVVLLGAVFVRQRKRFLKLCSVVVCFALLLNIVFGAAMNYRQVNITVGENCVVVHRGSTAAVIAFGYYGCYQAEGFLDDLAISNVTLLLPELKAESTMYKVDEIFENYNIERLILRDKHEYRFLTEKYEITDNTAFEFGGVRFEYCGGYCRVVSAAGTAVIVLEPDAERIETDFIITINGLPQWVKTDEYTAVINGGKNIAAAYGGEEYFYDAYVQLQYNGFGRYYVNGGYEVWQA